MGLIREPEGVDFSIQSKPLTKEELALSAYIRKYKMEHKSDLKDKKGKDKRKRTVKAKVVKMAFL